MEVHAHTHTPRKKWPHYFWEFLMLFLAVFCGFLAEYQLEHLIENQREKKYAVSLLEDLINDTVDLNNDINFWERIVKRTDTVRAELEKEPAQRDQLLLYRCVMQLYANNTFLYNDRTIDQLKNAGNFRLIRKKNVADSLVSYDNWIRTTLMDIEKNYATIIAPGSRELRNKLFNSRFYDLRNNPVQLDSAVRIHPELIEIAPGKKDIELEFYNSLNDFKQHNSNRLRFLRLLSGKSILLINMIKKEYHLK